MAKKNVKKQMVSDDESSDDESMKETKTQQESDNEEAEEEVEEQEEEEETNSAEQEEEEEEDQAKDSVEVDDDSDDEREPTVTDLYTFSNFNANTEPIEYKSHLYDEETEESIIPPNGYQWPELQSALTLDSLDSKKQLWLIEYPSEFQIKKLEGLKLPVDELVEKTDAKLPTSEEFEIESVDPNNYSHFIPYIRSKEDSIRSYHPRPITKAFKLRKHLTLPTVDVNRIFAEEMEKRKKMLEDRKAFSATLTRNPTIPIGGSGVPATVKKDEPVAKKLDSKSSKKSDKKSTDHKSSHKSSKSSSKKVEVKKNDKKQETKKAAASEQRNKNKIEKKPHTMKESKKVDKKSKKESVTSKKSSSLKKK